MSADSWRLVILGAGIMLTSVAAYFGAYFGARGPKDDE